MKKLEAKPFALLGVNVNTYDSKKLNEVMVNENLNWRSMANQGAITEKWNSPATPVYYVIDPDGVIRYKWVGDPGEKAIDAVLEQLIQAAEKNATKTPQ